MREWWSGQHQMTDWSVKTERQMRNVPPDVAVGSTHPTDVHTAEEWPICLYEVKWRERRVREVRERRVREEWEKWEKGEKRYMHMYCIVCISVHAIIYVWHKLSVFRCRYYPIKGKQSKANLVSLCYSHAHTYILTFLVLWRTLRFWNRNDMSKRVSNQSNLHIQTYIHTYIHTHIHTHTHSYTHTFTYTCIRTPSKTLGF